MSDNSDLPFGGLPSAGPVRFEASQLEAAVFEVRFLASSRELSPGDAQRMLGSLPNDVSHVEPAAQHEMAFTLGPDGAVNPNSSVSARGWQFSSGDRVQTYTVLPTRASVQVSVYDRWSETMKPSVEALLASVEESVSPTLCQRIGLRYINRLDGDRSIWAPMLGSALSGVFDHPVLGRLSDHVQGEFGLSLEPNVKVLVRYGIVPSKPDGPGGFLLDLDGYVEKSSPFDAAEIASIAQRLNRTLVAVMWSLLSPEGVEKMSPTELPSPGVVR